MSSARPRSLLARVSVSGKLRTQPFRLVGSSASLRCAPFAGGDFFSKFAFAGVLIDEAAQATELAAIVPLILRGVGNCA